MPEEDQLISTPTTRPPLQLRSPTTAPAARPSVAPGVCTMPRPRRDEEIIWPTGDQLLKRSRSSLTLALSEFPRIVELSDSKDHRFDDFHHFLVFFCALFLEESFDIDLFGVCNFLRERGRSSIRYFRFFLSFPVFSIASVCSSPTTINYYGCLELFP